MRNFSSSDPGYWKYVRAWTKLLHAGQPPTRYDGDLTETIFDMSHWRFEETECAERARVFRRFTTSVALSLVNSEDHLHDILAGSYLAADLLVDIEAGNRKQRSLVTKVVAATRKAMIEHCDEQYPFFTFAEMVLAQWAGKWEQAEAAATQLIADDAAVRSGEYFHGEDAFLLGLSVYDSHHCDFIHIAGTLKNRRQHEDTQLVIESIRDQTVRSSRRVRVPLWLGG